MPMQPADRSEYGGSEESPPPNVHTSTRTNEHLTRRHFLKTSAASAALVASGNFAYAAGSDTLRVGLVGCGGRGTGAARDAVVAAANVGGAAEIYAMGDLFEDQLDRSREQLQTAIPDALNVTDERTFVGFDNYLGVIGSGVDVVILATPPGFRPQHYRACVEAGKHVFMEKPIAVDPTGVRHVLETGQMADARGLSVVTGTIYRRQRSFVEAVACIHEGLIGEITGAYEYYLTGSLWMKPRLPGMSDMEWQCRNWLYFTWLSGDHIVEQFVHNLDVINWVMGSHPERALAMGGRLQRVDPSFGHIYDHFSVEFEYPGGVRVEAKCRQMEGAAKRVTNRIVGTHGVADLHTDRAFLTGHDGAELFRHPERGGNGYVMEHEDLIASIRDGRPINETQQIAESTLTGILGRESAYTGRELTWDDILNATQNLAPGAYAFGDLPLPPVPVPGLTQLDRPAFAHASVE